MAEDLGEKSEQPTGKRLLEARRKGQVAKSQNLSAALLLAAAVTVIYIFSEGLISGMAGSMRRALDPSTLGADVRGDYVSAEITFSAAQALRLAGPILIIMFVIALVEQIVQIGWFLSPEPLRPKLSKLNVISGFKKMFSLKSAVKGVIDVAKVAVLAVLSWFVIKSDYDRIIGLPALTTAGALVMAAEIALRLALWCVVALLIIGVIDRFYQKWQHTKDLRMTKHEVKDERRSLEGDMQTKARRMRMARDIAYQKMSSTVPKADVVVTNPTHFAVALKYDSATMSAPRVIAKGADYMAMQIRLLAAANGVPIVERPALARALYHGVDVGREVPAEQYEAVAEVLAYVYRLEGKLAS